MMITGEANMLVITGEANIQAARMLTLRSALKLEAKGLKRHGRSVLSIVKQEFGLKGNAVKVLPQFEAILRERGILS